MCVNWTSCHLTVPISTPSNESGSLTRRLCLHNRYFGFLDGVVAAVEEQFAEGATPNDTLRRLCALIQDAMFNSIRLGRQIQNRKLFS